MYKVVERDDRTVIDIYNVPGDQAPVLRTAVVTLADCTLSNDRDRLDIDLPVAAAFVVSDSVIPTTVTGDKIGADDAGASPVGEVIFAHSYDALNYFSRPFGRLQRVPDVTMLDTTSSNIATLQGIFDGPFPMPGQNLAPYFATTDTFADVGYGTTQEEESFRTLDVAVSIGIKSSLTFTKGVGAGYEASVESGWGWETRDTTSTVSISDLKETVALDGEAKPKVVPYGTAHGTGMQFVANVYRFLTPDPKTPGAYMVARDACVWATMWAAPIGKLAIPYIPFSVTPGDITTYTAEAWNETMRRHGYSGWDYFNDVIVANAYTFPHLKTPYIEIPLSVGSSPVTAIELNTSHFTESRWTFDFSFYGGVSGGVGVDFFGIGEELQFEVLGGLSFSINSSEASRTGETWGIKVDRVYFPKFVKHPSTDTTVGVQAFTVRLYLLPASARWTEELRALRPELAASIDPKSEPWRIAYQVTSYTLTDGTRYPALKTAQASPHPPKANMRKMRYGATPGVWATAKNVRYAVRFESSLGGEQGPWSNVETPPHANGSCPELNIPFDVSRSPATTRRRVIRQIDGGPEVTVKVIPNNDPASSLIHDDDPKVNFQPQTAPTINPGEQWRGRVSGQSPVWSNQLGWRSPANEVSYAVSFTFASEADSGGKTLPAFWARESMLSKPSAPASIAMYAYPTLSNVPKFPTGPNVPRCTGRNIYRTVRHGRTGTFVERDRLVGHIPDNTTETFADITD